MTRGEAISKIRLLQEMIASKNKEDKKYVCALQMGIEALLQPEIVRCKNCKHRETSDCWQYFPGDKTKDNWFCAGGERKDGGQDERFTD